MVAGEAGGTLRTEVGVGLAVDDGATDLAVGRIGHGVSWRGILRGGLQVRSMCPTTPHLRHLTGSRQSLAK